jgi:hypothetical protein
MIVAPMLTPRGPTLGGTKVSSGEVAGSADGVVAALAAPPDAATPSKLRVAAAAEIL